MTRLLTFHFQSTVTRVMKTVVREIALSIFIVVLLTVTLYGQMAASHSPILELVEEWQYHWGDLPKNAEGDITWDQETNNALDWYPLTLPNKLPGRNHNNYVWQKIRLPEGAWRDPAIFITGVLTFFEVYLEGKLIYRAENIGEQRIQTHENNYFLNTGRVVGTPWHVIQLQPGFQGKTLYLRIYSNVYMIGVRGKVLLGSRADIYERVIEDDLSKAIIGIVCIFLGLAALILFVFNRSQYGFLSYGWFAFWIGIYILCRTNSKQFFTQNYIVWFYLREYSLLFMPVGLIAFVEQTFGKGYKSIIRYLWQGHILFLSLLSVLTLLLPDQLANGFFALIRCFILIETIVILIFVSIAAYRDYHHARIFLVGFLALLIVSGYEVLVGLNIIPTYGFFIHYGMFFLIVSMIVILGRNYTEMYHNVIQYSQSLKLLSEEKTKITSELHDGIGGIMTNISLLAEIAKTTPPGKQFDNALTTIATLSQEGLSEIRSFMRSFDVKETDFDSLVADFRHYGMNTLKPYGINFKMDSSNQLPRFQPNALFILNVYRIYKESLVNVIKHSQAKNVAVALTITSNTIKLMIKDDGIGIPASHRPGRGLLNMKSRAKELGGSLTITSENGTRIELEIFTQKIPMKGDGLSPASRLYS